jgi:polyferredoxin
MGNAGADTCGADITADFRESLLLHMDMSARSSTGTHRENEQKKWKPNHTLASLLQPLRKAILLGGLLMPGIGMSFDFAQYEPYSMYRPQTAACLAVGIGVVSLILSAFIPRPFCRFGCPLGEMLEQVR